MKGIVFDSTQFVYLMFGFAGTLCVVWGFFWIAVMRAKTKPVEVINNSGFLRVITVGFTLSAVVILSLAQIISGELAGAIISGIVGYVLGSINTSQNKAELEEKK